MCSRLPDGCADIPAFVAAEVIEHDDVAWTQSGQQKAPDPKQEEFAIDRAIEDARCDDPVSTQAGDERHRVPVAMRCCSQQALTAFCPAMGAGHVCFRPGLIDEDQAIDGDPALVAAPEFTLAGDVRPVLLRRAQCFF